MADIAVLAEQLSGSSRRSRQDAAEQLAGFAKEQPEALVDFIPDFIDALNRPESQTRWECLDILTCMAPLAPAACAEAVPGAELALFDEENSMVRLWAMIFLCEWGRLSEANGLVAWPLIDEAVKCYHGDMEFSDMLTAVQTFSQGNLAPEVKKGIAAAFAFDAENARGWLQKKVCRIIENVM